MKIRASLADRDQIPAGAYLSEASHLFDRQGLDLCWRYGILLLQYRIRRTVDCMVLDAKKAIAEDGEPNAKARAAGRSEALAQALLEMGEVFKVTACMLV